MHYTVLRRRCAEAGMHALAAKQATSLLRYIGLIPADKAFYDAGKSHINDHNVNDCCSDNANDDSTNDQHRHQHIDDDAEYVTRCSTGRTQHGLGVSAPLSGSSCSLCSAILTHHTSKQCQPGGKPPQHGLHVSKSS